METLLNVGTACQDSNLTTRKSLVTKDLAKLVRSHLTEQENLEVDDRMLNQFLRATKQDADKVSAIYFLLSHP